jgi:pantetheine-phosphate adenylyltransferase
MKRIGIYSGSFDPLTHGHLWVISQGVKLFDELYIAVGTNVSKNHIFEWDFRIQMVKENVKFKNIKVDKLQGTIIDFAKNILRIEESATTTLLRGIRNAKDITYESNLCDQIREFDDGLQTVFVIPPAEYIDVSSTNIRKAAEAKDWDYVMCRVQPKILRIIMEKYNGR